MSTSTTSTLNKANVGVFTNPSHDLWIAESSPTLKEVQQGEALKEGYVTIGIKSTGICGSVSSQLTRVATLPDVSATAAQTSTSGMPAASVQ